MASTWQDVIDFAEHAKTVRAEKALENEARKVAIKGAEQQVIKADWEGIKADNEKAIASWSAECDRLVEKHVEKRNFPKKLVWLLKLKPAVQPLAV